jgi:translation initiation factor IF-1
VPREDAIKVEGLVVEALPNTLYRVQLANGHQVMAHTSCKMRLNFVRIAAGDGRFDERIPNAIHYQTPKLGDFQFNIAYSPHEQQTAGEGVNDRVVSMSLTYIAGDLDIAAAIEKHGEDRSRGERSGVRLAAGYRVAPELRLVGFFQSLNHEESDEWSSDVIGAGVEYWLTDFTILRGQYLMRNSVGDAADSNLFTVGIEQRLDQAVRVYANYAVMTNDDNADLNPYTQARSTGEVPRVPGETTSGLSVGLMFNF